MKVYSFIIKRVFLRRTLLTLSIIALLFISSYISFTTSRSLFSTFQGEKEMEFIEQPGSYIANLDPNNSIDTNVISNKTLQTVYDYLDSHFSYALYTDGFTTDLFNDENMEVNLSYFNEDYYALNTFPLSAGEDLFFTYNIEQADDIPILIGKGLSKEYPLGSSVSFFDPALQRNITARVQGILEENMSHSNFYALNSKQYYNFSIMIPANNIFLQESHMDLKLNALMDIIIMDTNNEQLSELGKVIQQNLNLKFNFFNQKQNVEYFHDYYVSSLKVIVAIALILLVTLLILSIWNALIGVRLTIKDLTINFLVGLSYSRLRGIFYTYYGFICCASLLFLFAITAYSRYGTWLRKDSTFATYGLFGMINMDWLALLSVVLINTITLTIIVETSLWRIRKIPISLGVLQ